MASISKASNGRRLVQFIGADGKRRTIRLGKVSQEQAEAVKVHITQLVAAAVTTHSPRRDTVAWVNGLDKVMRGRLAAAGLVRVRGSGLLGPFLDSYIKSRSDVKPGTATLYETVKGNLVDHFGADKPMREISPGDADEWRLSLIADGLADNTVRRRCGHAKQFFRAALRKTIIDENPFADFRKLVVKGNKKRMFFVRREIIQAVLDACPDAEWKLIIALARYGGLRCPSEHLALRWGDVNWEKNRMTVHSPKTEHIEGKESRVVPIFPELRPFLQDAFDIAPEGQEFVIRRYRDDHSNLRTQFNRILTRAGVQCWPKPFNNMRSTRETELSEEFPGHVVTAWIGNSKAVADEHYLQVTDDHFDRATEKALQNALQQPGAIGGNVPQGAQDRKGESSDFRGFPNIAEDRRDLEAIPSVLLGCEL